MELKEELANLGLTKSEAEAYIALVKLEETQTGKLCSYLKIPTSHIYQILSSLMEKGLVTFKVVNGVRVYKASNSKSLQFLYEEQVKKIKSKENEVIGVIQQLEKIPLEKTNASDYEYFEGIRGIKSMWMRMNELLIPNTESQYIVGELNTWETLNAFYLEHHKIRAKKRIFERMILPRNAKLEAKERKKIGYFEARFLDKLPPGELGIFDNFVVIQYTNTETPRGFLIKDKIFTTTFRFYFEQLWKIAKK
jgi:sugar-specific transcriptional regulator TrmB